MATLETGKVSLESKGRNPSSPPRLEDLEDLEEVDHCFFRPRPRVSPLLLLGSEAAVDAWTCGELSLQSSDVPSSSAYWAIFRDSMSCTSLSSSRMFSMVSPYHSSCQHQACRWARTITRRRPAQSQRTEVGTAVGQLESLLICASVPLLPP